MLYITYVNIKSYSNITLSYKSYCDFYITVLFVNKDLLYFITQKSHTLPFTLYGNVPL